MADPQCGLGQADLIIAVGGHRIPVSSLVLGRYCAQIAQAMSRPDQLDRDQHVDLPLIQWQWPADSVRIPLAFDPHRAAVPVAEAANVVLILCYQQFKDPWSRLQTAVQAMVQSDPYRTAVVSVLALHVGWGELHSVLDGLLAELPAPLLGVDTIRFAKQVGLRATLRAAIRVGVVLDPFELESVGDVTLAEVSDALLTWPDPPVRFIHLVRCAGQLDLNVEQIVRKVRHDPFFFITIDGIERLRALLLWVRTMDIWGDDFFRGWFSRCGVAVVDRIKFRSRSSMENIDGNRVLYDLRMLMQELIKNELVVVPNPDPKWSYLNFEQRVDDCRPLYRYSTPWQQPASYLV